MLIPKYGVVAASRFIATNYPDFLRDSFQDVKKGGIDYKAIFTFEENIVSEFYDYIFDDAIAYTNWINEAIYIIIPTELVPNLETMVDLVEDIVFEDQFDVVLDKSTITSRSGNTGDVVTLSVKMITCKVARWEDGDDEKLQSIINLFNSFYNPPRQITFDCKFNSLSDLEYFKTTNAI